MRTAGRRPDADRHPRPAQGQRHRRGHEPGPLRRVRPAAEDPELRVAILTGAGDRFFSAGWDLKAAAAGEGVDADHGPGGFAGITEFLDIGKPVIAAVNGLALGGGFELVLAADMVVAADHAEFALTEVTLGLVPDAGGMLRLPARMPRPSRSSTCSPAGG